MTADGIELLAAVNNTVALHWDLKKLQGVARFVEMMRAPPPVIDASRITTNQPIQKRLPGELR